MITNRREDLLQRIAEWEKNHHLAFNVSFQYSHAIALCVIAGQCGTANREEKSSFSVFIQYEEG